MTITRICIITTASILLLGCGNDVASSQDNSGIKVLEADQGTSSALIEKNKEATMRLIGTIEYQDFEGGFYGFIAENGKKYTLNNLAKEHRRDGLIIEISAEPMLGMATTTQFGELLTVHTVKVIDDSKVKVIRNNNAM